MRLTVAGHSFEILPLEGTMAVAQQLGFKGIDIAGFHARGHASLEPEEVAANPQGMADRIKGLLDKYELDAVDFFPQFGASPDQHSLNDPNPAVRARNHDLIRGAAHFCQLVGIPGFTILPGVDHPKRTLAENLALAGEEMQRATEIAGEFGVMLRYEPHVGSVTYTPELAVELIESYAPDARITLDYSHFVLQYISQDRIHTMIPYTGHFHIRAAKPGKLQVSYADNEIDFRDIIRGLAAAGYDGALSVEYVCQDWYGCNQIDTLYETAVTRDALLPWVGQL